MPFTVGCFPFYSVILGFLEYHWFPLFTPLGTKTNVVSTTLVAGSFLILHGFPLLRFSLQKTPVDFPVLGVLKGYPLVFLFPRFLDSTFQTHLLAVFPFIIFPKWADSFLPGWKILSHLPSWFFFLGSLRYQALTYELLVPKSSDPFFASLGGW